MVQYLPMIRSRAASWSQTTGVPFDELFSQAIVICAEALQKHDESRGAQTTFLYQCMNSELAKFVRRFRFMDSSFSLDYGDEVPVNAVPSPYGDWNTLHKVMFQEALAQLGADAKALVEAVLVEPAERLRLTGTENLREFRAALRDHAKNALSMSDYRFTNARNEIRTMLHQIED